MCSFAVSSVPAPSLHTVSSNQHPASLSSGHSLAERERDVHQRWVAVYTLAFPSLFLDEKRIVGDVFPILVMFLFREYTSRLSRDSEKASASAYTTSHPHQSQMQRYGAPQCRTGQSAQNSRFSPQSSPLFCLSVSPSSASKLMCSHFWLSNMYIIVAGRIPIHSLLLTFRVLDIPLLSLIHNTTHNNR